MVVLLEQNPSGHHRKGYTFVQGPSRHKPWLHSGEDAGLGSPSLLRDKTSLVKRHYERSIMHLSVWMYINKSKLARKTDVSMSSALHGFKKYNEHMITLSYSYWHNESGT